LTIENIYDNIYVDNRKEQITMSIKRNDGMNAVQRYQAKCDCITIRPLADVGAAIRSAASASGMSVTQYILTAINFYEQHKGDTK
jgi:hypothetical protein